MKLLTCNGGALRIHSAPAPTSVFTTGIQGWNALAPAGGLARHAIHELLFDHSAAPPAFAAMTLARQAMQDTSDASAGNSTASVLMWCDVDHTLYPPALIAAGITIDRLYILRPKPTDVIAAVTECLRCKGVAAVVATLPPRVSQVEARRMQLAAEQGGSVGLLLRTLPHGNATQPYAAATRWLISPAPGDRTVQRWNVQLIHGHGGRLGHSFLLENRRERLAETDSVHLPPKLADHPQTASLARASA